MKRRFSPAARRAHLAHLRAKYGKDAPLPFTLRLDQFTVAAQHVQPEPAPRCKECQKEKWAKPIEGRYSFDPEGGAA